MTLTRPRTLSDLAWAGEFDGWHAGLANADTYRPLAEPCPACGSPTRHLYWHRRIRGAVEVKVVRTCNAPLCRCAEVVG
jgi:hypothetical protein